MQLKSDRMLYDFYRDKTSKKPGSIHATFLITGTQTRKPPEAPKGPAVDNEDTPMQSSPFPSSPPQMQEPEEEPVEQRVVTLVREEHLERRPAISLSIHQLIESSSQTEIH